MAEYYENVLFVILVLALGGWSTAVGHGYWLPPVKDMAEADAWKARHGRKLKVIGPLMIAIACLYTACNFSSMRTRRAGLAPAD